MSDKKLLKFKLKDGTSFFFEVAVPEGTPSGPGFAGKVTDKLTEEAEGAFDNFLDVVGPVTQKVVERLKTGLTKDASEVEVKFGLKLTASADVVFATAGGDVNFEITLKWKNA